MDPSTAISADSMLSLGTGSSQAWMQRSGHEERRH
jgi:hypothetical protein